MVRNMSESARRVRSQVGQLLQLPAAVQGGGRGRAGVRGQRRRLRAQHQHGAGALPGHHQHLRHARQPQRRRRVLGCLPEYRRALAFEHREGLRQTGQSLAPAALPAPEQFGSVTLGHAALRFVTNVICGVHRHQPKQHCCGAYGGSISATCLHVPACEAIRP